jgi:hypothetical protein
MLGHAGLRALHIMGLSLLVIAIHLAHADPAHEEHQPCPVLTQEQARWLGDVLFEQGAYQRAGECYQAAGEFALANRAFFKAVRPESAVTARELAEQREQAKTMVRKLQQAFRVDR